MRSYVALALGMLMICTGCAQNHTSRLHTAEERRMTLGVVQKDIKQGMSQAEVAELLGSPNIVTKDQNGDEAWVYDKLSSEVSYSKGQGGGLIGAVWSIVGIGGYYGGEAGAKAKTQKTLTVVIKFDENSLVQNLSYHSSQF